jgi:hypothetical protein
LQPDELVEVAARLHGSLAFAMPEVLQAHSVRCSVVPAREHWLSHMRKRYRDYLGHDWLAASVCSQTVFAEAEALQLRTRFDIGLWCMPLAFAHAEALQRPGGDDVADVLYGSLSFAQAKALQVSSDCPRRSPRFEAVAFAYAEALQSMGRMG